MTQGHAHRVRSDRPYGSLLTDEHVREIRASNQTQKALAERFGVTTSYISQLQTGHLRRDAGGLIRAPRAGRGSENGRAKLSETEVLELRRANGTLRDIAARFGVTITTVSQIKRHILWRHLVDG